MSINMFYEPQSNVPIYMVFSDDHSSKVYEDSTYTSYEDMVEKYMEIDAHRGFRQLPKNYEKLWAQYNTLAIDVYHKIEDKLDPTQHHESVSPIKTTKHSNRSKPISLPVKNKESDKYSFVA